ATGLLPGWAGIDLVQGFERELGLPSVALNDVHAMGLAEARLGAGRSSRVCLSVAVGTGIGGAITIDGRLVEGANGLAGAVGHIPVKTGGSICSCGRRGCIEAAAGGPAIARSFAFCRGRRRGPRPTGADRNEAGLPDVVDGLTSSDEPTRECALRATSTAGAAACVRLATPTLPRMFEAWTPAVLWLMKSASAICRFVCPTATSARTSRSRAVNPKGSRAATSRGAAGGSAAGSVAT